MTSLPPNADELVSSYLDGQAAPDEVAIVEANAELMGRVESLRQLNEQLTAPISVPQAQREAHLATALGAFDEMMGASTWVDATESAEATTVASKDEPAAPQVASLEAARQRRRPRRFTGLIAAAAAALLLFVGITALSVGRSSDSESVASDSADSAVSADVAATDGGGDDDADSAGDDAAFESAALEPADDDAARAGEGTAAAPIAPPAVEAEELVDSADDAMDEEEAMEEQDIDDETSASSGAAAIDEDTASDDSADSSAADSEPAPAPDSDGFYLGAFKSRDPLLSRLDELAPTALEARSGGLFPSCQGDIGELSSIPDPTLIATADLAGSFVEIHVLNGDELLIVDPVDCTVTERIPLVP